MILYGGTNTTYQYYSQNLRLYSITTTSPTEGLQNLSYAYDNVGNITAITDHLNSSRNQTFAYDDLNRLTQAQGPYGPITYNYDPIGNMTYNSQVGYYTYDIKPHAVTQAGTNTYSYDDNGNMISGAGRTLIYDNENKPTSINSMSLSYDGNGDRVKKDSTVYIERLFECSVSDCTKYIFANGRRVALKRSTGEINYYSQDHLGSTTIVTNATGAKVEEIYYYPYGATRSDTGSVNLSHKYTGQELDDETDLYYYGARYYDPVLARFISADTIGPGFSDPQSLNRYSYVRNNPLRNTDPTGNQYESYDSSLWVSSIYGPLGSFGSSISQLGSFSITTGINFRLNINTSSNTNLLDYVGNIWQESAQGAATAAVAFLSNEKVYAVKQGARGEWVTVAEFEVPQGFNYGELNRDRFAEALNTAGESVVKRIFRDLDKLFLNPIAEVASQNAPGQNPPFLEPWASGFQLLQQYYKNILKPGLINVFGPIPK